MNLLSLFAEKRLISKSDALALEKESKKTGESVETLLVKHGIQPEDILATKGAYLKVPTRTIAEESIPFEILKYIPEESAVHYRFAPLAVNEGVLEIGAVDPDNTEALDALSFISA